jgi:hypothetical protein
MSDSGVRRAKAGRLTVLHRGSKIVPIPSPYSTQKKKRLLEPCRAPRPATALDGAFTDRGVVVGQLFAAADAPRCPNPDRLADDFPPAVGCARVIDEARDVAVDGGIPAPGPIQAEDPDAALLEVPLFPRAAVAIAHELASVVDDPRVLVDRPVGKDAPAVDFGSSANDSWKARRRGRPASAQGEAGYLCLQVQLVQSTRSSRPRISPGEIA